VPRLEALVQQHPFDERLRGQLMLALYRSGRQAEALFTYQATRALLVEELGLEPGPRLKELEAAILRQDVALTAPAVRAPLPTAMGDGCLLRMVRRHEEPVGRYHDAENGPQRREVSVPRKIDAVVHSGAWTAEDAEERICLL
jgi:DNA-binding SARP family transcriptional activator